MSYEQAFAAVPGCEVIWCEYFGSYSGRLLAKVEYKGEILYVSDWFGSCTGCDSFEGTFGYTDSDAPDYQSRLADFGKSYIESALPYAQIVSSLEAESNEWDDEVREMLEKLRAEATTRGQ